MKRDLMDILACPTCKGDLELIVKEREEEDVVTGSLFCSRCSQHYPIEDGIPNLLPPHLR